MGAIRRPCRSGGRVLHRQPVRGVATSTRVSFRAAPGSPGGPASRASALQRRPSREGRGEGPVEEVTDEPLYRDRVCGIDIGKAELYATIRVPSDTSPQRRMSETRGFATTRRGVLALADWLRSWQVPAVVMEATSTYWMGPFFRLEAEGFECVLADAKQVKNLPGRVSGTRRIPAGWRSASSAARSGRASSPRRSSGSSGCTPATAATSSTSAPGRRTGRRSC